MATTYPIVMRTLYQPILQHSVIGGSIEVFACTIAACKYPISKIILPHYPRGKKTITWRQCDDANVILNDYSDESRGPTRFPITPCECRKHTPTDHTYFNHRASVDAAHKGQFQLSGRPAHIGNQLAVHNQHLPTPTHLCV